MAQPVSQTFVDSSRNFLYPIYQSRCGDYNHSNFDEAVTAFKGTTDGKLWSLLQPNSQARAVDSIKRNKLLSSTFDRFLSVGGCPQSTPGYLRSEAAKKTPGYFGFNKGGQSRLSVRLLNGEEVAFGNNANVKWNEMFKIITTPIAGVSVAIPDSLGEYDQSRSIFPVSLANFAYVNGQTVPFGGVLDTGNLAIAVTDRGFQLFVKAGRESDGAGIEYLGEITLADIGSSRMIWLGFRYMGQLRDKAQPLADMLTERRTNKDPFVPDDKFIIALEDFYHGLLISQAYEFGDNTLSEVRDRWDSVFVKKYLEDIKRIIPAIQTLREKAALQGGTVDNAAVEEAIKSIDKLYDAFNYLRRTFVSEPSIASIIELQLPPETEDIELDAQSALYIRVIFDMLIAEVGRQVEAIRKDRQDRQDFRATLAVTYNGDEIIIEDKSKDFDVFDSVLGASAHYLVPEGTGGKVVFEKINYNGEKDFGRIYISINRKKDPKDPSGSGTPSSSTGNGGALIVVRSIDRGGGFFKSATPERTSVSADWSLVDQEKLRGSATLSDPLLGVNEAAAMRRRHEQASRANVRKTAHTNAALAPATRPTPMMFMGR